MKNKNQIIFTDIEIHFTGKQYFLLLITICFNFSCQLNVTNPVHEEIPLRVGNYSSDGLTNHKHTISHNQKRKIFKAHRNKYFMPDQYIKIETLQDRMKAAKM